MRIRPQSDFMLCTTAALAAVARVSAKIPFSRGWTNISNWLYNGGTVTATSRPADLGCFIGSRITESYYNSKSDKRQTLVDILNVTSFSAFLTASGYDPR